MKEIDKVTLNKSLAWIKAHPQATNLDVPDELLHAWICDTKGVQSLAFDPSPSHLSVFFFGLAQQRLLAQPELSAQGLAIPESEVRALFARWQMKLGVVEVHRNTEFAFKPMPLFSFSEDETLEVVPR